MIVAILQARMSSSRLPGKVNLPLAGAPMLARQLERIRRSRMLDRIMVATSDKADDDIIAAVARDAGVGIFRGSLDDVLDRFYRAALAHAPSHIVRLTGDCPLADWQVIDRLVNFALDGRYDYASNTLRPTWPDGLDAEVATLAALRSAWTHAKTPVEREHVMPFITSRPNRFRLGSFEQDTDLSALRWTVDEPRDYDFVRSIYERLYPGNPAFTTDDILNLIAREPALSTINAGIERNKGLCRPGQDTGKDRVDE